MGHACLAGDSLVQTNSGAIQAIAELSEWNLLAVDNRNKLQIVNAQAMQRSVRHDIKTVYEIDTGHQITVSPEHRFFKLCKFGLKEVKASQIRKGDYLMHAGSIRVLGTLQKIPAKEPVQIVMVSKNGAQLVKQCLNQIGQTRGEICHCLDITPRQLRRVLNQGCPTAKSNLEKIAELSQSEEILENIMPLASNKHKVLRMPEFFTKELAQITGYMLGDGFIGKRNIEFKDSREEVLKEYQKLFKIVFNCDCRISKINGKNAFRMRINSREITELMQWIKKNYVVLVPKSEDDTVKAFIKGFVDAEGSIDSKIRRITIAQNDKKILQFIQLLLLRFGIGSRLTRYNKPAYSLDLFSENVVKYGELIGVSAPDKNQKLQKWICTFKPERAKRIIPMERSAVWQFLAKTFEKEKKPIPYRNYRHITLQEGEKIALALEGKEIKEDSLKNKKEFLMAILHGEVKFEKVRTIRKMTNNQPLYDLSVPLTENYIANGFVVHNSKTRLYLRKSKGEKRIAKLVDSPSLPDGEALYQVTEKGIEDVKDKSKD
ncbi:MAG: LAGLIDADG family homing endonuclease [Candidatus Diapherotrites archaeon]